jgi:hypothetical protein
LADEIGLRRVAERNDSNPERDLCKSAADFQSAEESVAFLTGSADKMSAARCFAEVLITGFTPCSFDPVATSIASALKQQ